ncbi:MAG: hypothetical protein PHX61_14125 [Alphaproteobacteria bacterium]|nr:hypothetical protein [Alphaproteobacteria bacterium]
MELIFIIAVPVIAAIVLIILCLKMDWKEVDEQNQQYYVDGYHIYYDRKIIRQLNNKKKI